MCRVLATFRCYFLLFVSALFVRSFVLVALLMAHQQNTLQGLPTDSVQQPRSRGSWQLRCERMPFFVRYNFHSEFGRMYGGCLLVITWGASDTGWRRCATTTARGIVPLRTDSAVQPFFFILCLFLCQRDAACGRGQDSRGVSFSCLL